MNKITLAAAVCGALAATLAFAGPFDAFKGKMKEGMYETKIEMDMGQMPGMPKGMGKQTRTHQHCVTASDIEKGETMGKGRDGKGPNESCEVKNMNVSGNTATYTMTCTKPKMTADNKITFSGTGYVMDMDMSMDQGGQMMNMKQHMESKYIGPCAK
jgi:hypothetical protein